jgi:uncharacterized membrane protein
MKIVFAQAAILTVAFSLWLKSWNTFGSCVVYTRQILSL